MHNKEHLLDKYILNQKASLDAVKNDDVYDTASLQVMCLEKFASYQGYELKDGLFTQDNPACRVMTLDSMVRLYNDTMLVMGEYLKGHAFVKRIYLSGRNLRKPVVIQKHRVQFL